MLSCEIRAAQLPGRPGFAAVQVYRGPSDNVNLDLQSQKLRLLSIVENCTTHVLHDPNSFLRLGHKIILLLLNFLPGLLTYIDHLIIGIHAPTGTSLALRLRSIKNEPRILHSPPSPCREHEIRIQRRAPTS